MLSLLQGPWPSNPERSWSWHSWLSCCIQHLQFFHEVVPPQTLWKWWRNILKSEKNIMNKPQVKVLPLRCSWISLGWYQKSKEGTGIQHVCVIVSWRVLMCFGWDSTVATEGQCQQRGWLHRPSWYRWSCCRWVGERSPKTYELNIEDIYEIIWIMNYDIYNYIMTLNVVLSFELKVDYPILSQIYTWNILELIWETWNHTLLYWWSSVMARPFRSISSYSLVSFLLPVFHDVACLPIWWYNGSYQHVFSQHVCCMMSSLSSWCDWWLLFWC